MGIGWDKLGDLRNYKTQKDIQRKMQEIYNYEKPVFKAGVCFAFANDIKPGDVVFVKKGSLTDYPDFGTPVPLNEGRDAEEIEAILILGVQDSPFVEDVTDIIIKQVLEEGVDVWSISFKLHLVTGETSDFSTVVGN